MDETTRKAISSSVVTYPSAKEASPSKRGFIFNIASAADEITEWGVSVLARDRELRDFWKTEPFLASAVYNMVTKLATTDFNIVSSDAGKPRPRNTSMAIEAMLHRSAKGLGFQRFMAKLATDLYTQDNGAFIETVRREDSPNSPVIMLNNLDSNRCLRTGDPEYPVVYTDRKGKEHLLRWYQVYTVEEFPSPDEDLHNVQLCAVSRCLRAAQILRDIEIYKHEKVSGRFSRALHLVSGVTQDDLEDARIFAEEQAANQLLQRYVQPFILPTIDPEHRLSHVEIPLASLPDSFDEDETFRQYIAQLALAFGVDYQEFAPLPGGSLGSSQQSEILDKKTRGRGPSGILTLIESILNNNNILPKTVEFQFQTFDDRADKDRAEARYLRARDRSIRTRSGELSPEVAVKLALEDGDIPEHLAEEMISYLEVRPTPPDPEAFDPQQVEQGGESSPRGQSTPVTSLNMKLNDSPYTKYMKAARNWEKEGRISTRELATLEMLVDYDPDIVVRGVPDPLLNKYPNLRSFDAYIRGS